MAFSLAPAAFLLLAGEIVLRILNPGWMACVRTHACPHPEGAPRFVTEQKHNFTLETKEPLLVYDPVLFWRSRPHVSGTVWSTPGVRTNALGLRQSSLDLRRERDNILVVGDSVVWGSLVEEHLRFTDIASRELARRVGFAEAQIVNAGVVGYSSHQVYQYLRSLGMKRFKPRVIVVCVGVNDAWLGARSDVGEMRENQRPVARLRRALQRSDLFLFLRRYVSEAVLWARTGSNPEGLAFLYPGHASATPVARATPPETEANFQAIGALAKAHHAAMIVMMQAARVEHPQGWDRRGFLEAQDRVRAMADASGWGIIELASLEEPPWQLGPLEFLQDFCHLSPAGHAIVAQLLVDAVARIPPWADRPGSAAPVSADL